MPKLLMVIILSALATGCGTQVSTDGSQESESRLEIPNQPNLGTSSTTSCVTFSKQQLGFDGLITPYYSYLNNSYSNNEVQINLKNVSSEILTGQKYIHFFKQFDNENLSLITDRTAVKFVFILKSTSREISSIQAIDTLSLSNIQLALHQSGLSRLYNVNSFFEHFAIKLINVPIEFESLVIASYKNGETIHDAHTNVLIPAFEANPNIYSKQEKSNSLKMMHPLFGGNANLTSEESQLLPDYQRIIENRCRNF